LSGYACLPSTARRPACRPPVAAAEPPPPLLYSLPGAGRRELGERAAVDEARCRLDPQVRLEARIAHGQQQATAGPTPKAPVTWQITVGFYLPGKNGLGSAKKLQLTSQFFFFAA
jgi:hypothetical protein